MLQRARLGLWQDAQIRSHACRAITTAKAGARRMRRSAVAVIVWISVRSFLFGEGEAAEAQPRGVLPASLERQLGRAEKLFFVSHKCKRADARNTNVLFSTTLSPHERVF